MRQLRIGNSRRKFRRAPTRLIFTTENDKPVLYAVCLYEDFKIGPVQGDGEKSQKKILAQLTRECACPARKHVCRETDPPDKIRL